MIDIKLMKGDCLELMKEIPDGSVDMVLADPPYGTTSCGWDSVIPFEPMWKELHRVVKRNGAIVLFGSEPFSSALRMSNIKNYKYDWIWNKKAAANFPLAKYQPLKIHEIVHIFGAGTVNYYPEMTIGKMRNKKGYGSRNIHGSGIKETEDKVNNLYYPKSIVTFSNASQKGKVHPTQKPVDLLEYLIKTYTNECETVLDFTMGSGSTGVACKNTGRNFIGIELDEDYFKIAKERISDAK